MTGPVKKRKLDTAKQMHAAINKVVEKHAIEASKSEYDRKVCILAVSAAGDTIRRVPVAGTAIEYGQAVAVVLGELQDSYNDPDGEYTSGKAPIGGVYYDVLGLVDTQISFEHGDVDKKEARRIIIREMAELAHSLSVMPGETGDAPIEIEAQGPSGRRYILEITFAATTDREFTMLGKIYSENSRQYPLMEELFELIADDDN